MFDSSKVAGDCYEVFAFRHDNSPWQVDEVGTFGTLGEAQAAAELVRLFLVHGMFGSALKDLTPDPEDRLWLRSLPERLDAWGADPAHMRVEAVPYGSVCNCCGDRGSDGDEDEDGMADTEIWPDAPRFGSGLVKVELR